MNRKERLKFGEVFEVTEALATNLSEAVRLLARCRERFIHLPKTASDEHLVREIADFLESKQWVESVKKYL